MWVASLLAAFAAVIIHASSASAGSEASARSYKMKVTGTGQFESDYRTCYYVASCIGDQHGRNTAALAWASQSNSGACVVAAGTGWTGHLDVLEPNVTVSHEGTGGFFGVAAMSPFVNNTGGSQLASFPSTGTSGCIDVVNMAEPAETGCDSDSYHLPFGADYDWANHAVDPTTHSLYYTYLFGQQGAPQTQFQVVRVDTRNNSKPDSRFFVYTPNSADDSGPLRGMAALRLAKEEERRPDATPPGVVYAGADGMIAVITANNRTYWPGVFSNVTDTVHCIATSPVHPSSEILLLLGTAEADNKLVVVNVTAGVVSRSVAVGNSTTIVTGWGDHIALCGSDGSRLMDGRTLDVLAHIPLPEIGPYQHAPYNGLQGSFATDPKDDARATLYVVLGDRETQMTSSSFGLQAVAISRHAGLPHARQLA